MIVVLFEFEPVDGAGAEYLELSRRMSALVERTEGFLGIERFRSTTNDGKFLTLSYWQSEEALERWRRNALHCGAQRAGRDSMFRDYRLLVATVVRDYGMSERAEAPADSLEAHG